MAIDLNLEKRLAGLTPEARARVENALKEVLAKEGALEAFDRSGFDRGPYDRTGAEILSSDITEFPEKPVAEKSRR